MRITFFIAFLIVKTNFANGQDSGYQSGYVVMKSNDTIRGLVKYINQAPYRILTDVKFKESIGDKVEVYAPDDLIAYAADEKNFHSMKLPGIGQAFVELRVDGFLKLYVYRTSGFGAGTGTSSYYYLLKNGEKSVFSAQQGKFKDTVSAYLIDVTEVSDRVKTGEWKKGDLETIVKEYNRLRTQ